MSMLIQPFCLLTNGSAWKLFLRGWSPLLSRGSCTGWSPYPSFRWSGIFAMWFFWLSGSPA